MCTQRAHRLGARRVAAFHRVVPPVAGGRRGRNGERAGWRTEPGCGREGSRTQPVEERSEGEGEGGGWTVGALMNQFKCMR